MHTGPVTPQNNQQLILRQPSRKSVDCLGITAIAISALSLMGLVGYWSSLLAPRNGAVPLVILIIMIVTPVAVALFQAICFSMLERPRRYQEMLV